MTVGSSSERVGPQWPGQVGTDGLRDTSPMDPVADPRHEHKPYHG